MTTNVVPKAKVAPKPKPATSNPVVPKYKFGPAINQAPTKKLDVYVFGEGSAGELGLGALAHEGKKPIDVKRPRLNHLLKADDVGVVAIAVGGMHAVALTHDNKILTWGVNDNGALGRETPAGGKMVDIVEDGAEADDSDSDDGDSGLNPNEAEPREVDPKHFPKGTKFVSLLACDSATFALTEDGSVYGWGTFRVSLLFLSHFESNKSREMMATWVSEQVTKGRSNLLQSSFLNSRRLPLLLVEPTTFSL